MSISTHVLDSVTGRPAAGLQVVLLQITDDDDLAVLAVRTTDEDGRIGDLLADAPPGDYELHFAVEQYYAVPTFFPEVVIKFRITDAAAHHHVPLLLSPFAYSTYRGS